MTPREAAELFGDRLMFILCALVLTNLALMGMVGWFLFRHPKPVPIICARACVRTAETTTMPNGIRWLTADDGNALTLYPDGSLEHERKWAGEYPAGRILYPPLSVVHVEEA